MQLPFPNFKMDHETVANYSIPEVWYIHLEQNSWDFHYSPQYILATAAQNMHSSQDFATKVTNLHSSTRFVTWSVLKFDL